MSTSPGNKCRTAPALNSINLSPGSMRWNTTDTMDCLITGKEPVFGDPGQIHKRCWMLQPARLATGPWRRKRDQRQVTLICAVSHEVSGYHVKATGGEIGHVEDFLFDDETWQIRYVIVDTRNWWPAKKVLLRPQWIEKVSWSTRQFRTTIGREMIEKSPAWDPDSPVSREYELHLHQHYGYAPYWTVDSAASGVGSQQNASLEANE